MILMLPINCLVMNSISSSAVDQQGVKVASLMIETAKANLEKAKTKLASVKDKQRMLSVKTNNLLKELYLVCLPGSVMHLLRVKSPGKERKVIRIS